MSFVFGPVKYLPKTSGLEISYTVKLVTDLLTDIKLLFKVSNTLFEVLNAGSEAMPKEPPEVIPTEGLSFTSSDKNVEYKIIAKFIPGMETPNPDISLHVDHYVGECLKKHVQLFCQRYFINEMAPTLKPKTPVCGPDIGVDSTGKQYLIIEGDRSRLDEFVEELKMDDLLYDFSIIVTSNVTDMSELFKDFMNFDQDISKWDVSNVTNMDSMFEGASTFNRDLSVWETGMVASMCKTFKGAAVFTSDLSAWDVHCVSNMESMFEDATVFNSDLNSWNVCRVTTMKRMFADASGFGSGPDHDLDKWNTSNLTDITEMFKGAVAFNGKVGTWNTKGITNFTGVFMGAIVFNQEIGCWCTSNVTTMESMFDGAIAFNQYIGGWDTLLVENMDDMFNGSAFDQNISFWNVTSITSEPTEFGGVNADNKPLWGQAPRPLILTSKGMPESGTGGDGQFFNDIVGKKFYGPKSGGSWGDGVSYDGSIITGKDEPGMNVGCPGDIFVDICSNTFYGPKNAIGWGTESAAAKDIHSGMTPPENSLGMDGDYYINTEAKKIYGPKKDGVWENPITITETITVNNANPLEMNGETGDLWVNSTDKTIFGPKTMQGWGEPQDFFLFLALRPVNRGNFLEGSGVPKTTDGIDGDYYRNRLTNRLYGPKVSGEWPGSSVALSGEPEGPFESWLNDITTKAPLFISKYWLEIVFVLLIIGVIYYS